MSKKRVIGGWSSGTKGPRATTATSSSTTSRPAFRSTKSAETTKRIEPEVILIQDGCVLIRRAISKELQQDWIDDCLLYGEGQVAGVGSFYGGNITMKDGYVDPAVAIELAEAAINASKSSSVSSSAAAASDSTLDSTLDSTASSISTTSTSTSNIVQTTESDTAQTAPSSEESQTASVVQRTDLNLRTKARTYVPIQMYRERSGRFVEVALEMLRLAQQLTSIPDMNPEQCRINYYRNRGRIGWHFDRVPGLAMEEQFRVQSPIISFSIGNSAEFLYKNSHDEPERSVILESGDVIIFGGASRMLLHSIPKIIANTTPRGIDLKHLAPGRLNIGFY